MNLAVEDLGYIRRQRKRGLADHDPGVELDGLVSSERQVDRVGTRTQCCGHNRERNKSRREK